MSCTLPDGTYEAALHDVTVFTSREGVETACFTWGLLGTGERVTSVLTLVTSTGQRNLVGIQITQKFATGWDGTSLAWLKENFDRYAANRVTIKLFEGRVDWIWPKDGVAIAPRPPQSCNGANDVKLVINRELLGELAQQTSPERDEVWTLFAAVTEGMSALDQKRVWTRLYTNINPHLLAFGQSDWLAMIDAIKHL